MLKTRNAAADGDDMRRRALLIALLVLSLAFPMSNAG